MQADNIDTAQSALHSYEDAKERQHNAELDTSEAQRSLVESVIIAGLHHTLRVDVCALSNAIKSARNECPACVRTKQAVADIGKPQFRS